MRAMAAQADVLNLGGTQNADGTWNGLASLVMAPMGNANNAADAGTEDLCARMSCAYSIGKYDVTAGQYTAFLDGIS
jgi:hypothetical protein